MTFVAVRCAIGGVIGKASRATGVASLGRVRPRVGSSSSESSRVGLYSRGDGLGASRGNGLRAKCFAGIAAT